MRNHDDAPFRATEQSTAERFAAWNGASQLKFDRWSHVDRVLYRGDVVVGFIEIKTRSSKFGQFPVFMVSRLKILDLRILQSLLSVPVFLVVHFGCGTIGHINVWAEHRIVENWGRDDRGDPADRETAAVFQWEQFKIIQ